MTNEEFEKLKKFTAAMPLKPKMNFLIDSNNFFLGEGEPNVGELITNLDKMHKFIQDIAYGSNELYELVDRARKILGDESTNENNLLK